jgi:hypothetical protein
MATVRVPKSTASLRLVVALAALACASEPGSEDSGDANQGSGVAGASAGTSGVVGTSGAAGASGVAGTSGAAGTSDDAGAPGTAGTSGAGTDPPEPTDLSVEGLQVVGTHNSYHQASAIAFDASHAYTHKPLDQQLTGGVRALELDLHLGSNGAFEVYHISLIDQGASCLTLEACLGVVATWSADHPLHAPVFIWFEVKDDTGGGAIDDLVPIEAVILEAFARERIMTPAWLRGTHDSPRARLMATGWPALDEARGMVLFALIDRDARTKAYSHDGTSLDDRVMWVNAAPAEFDQPWAAITKVEEQGLQAVIAQAHTAHLLIAANTCAANMTDEACAARFGEFADAGVHMLHDDLPFQIPGRNYWARLPGGASPACNPVTALAGCAAPLE